MGAAAVLEMIAAAPDRAKFSVNPSRGLAADSSDIYTSPFHHYNYTKLRFLQL